MAIRRDRVTRAVHHRRYVGWRYIAKICPQVVEFGPVNETIHKIDENVIVADIEPLKNVYRRTLEALLK